MLSFATNWGSLNWSLNHIHKWGCDLGMDLGITNLWQMIKLYWIAIIYYNSSILKSIPKSYPQIGIRFRDRFREPQFVAIDRHPISQGKVEKTTATPHFVPNFVVFNMTLSETSFWKGFNDLKNTPFSILQIFPSRFIDKILLYSVLDLTIQNTILTIYLSK